MASEVKTHMSRGEVQLVEDARAQLVTSIVGATLSFDTEALQPGHAYTAWWVIINKPEACEGSPCTSKEVLTQTEALDADVGYATGVIADEYGTANFFAHLPLGDIPQNWFGNGFSNPRAEIHVVINDHGPVIPGQEEEMTSTYRGGCTDESLPGIFPDTAKADGLAGPNACQLYQFAIFQQQDS